MLSIALTALLSLFAAAQPADPPAPGMVFGRVVDATTGQPIAGAIVTLFGSASVPIADATGRTSGAPHLMTNAAGQFVARGLRPGTLFLTATKGGYINGTNAQRRPNGSSQPIQVAAGHRVTDVEVRMWRQSAVVGTVVDEVGEPIVGARVQAFAREFIGGRPRFVAGTTGVTDDRGIYRLAGLAPGEFKICVNSSQVSVPTGFVDSLLQGSADARRIGLAHDMETIGAAIAPAGTQFALRSESRTISLRSGTATPIPRDDGSFLVYPTTFYPVAQTSSQASTVSVRAGEEKAGVDIQMLPVRAVKVAGNIVTPGGLASNVPIRLIAEGDEDLQPDFEAAATISDLDGGFMFPAVAPGRYLLRIVRIPRLPVVDEDSNAVTRLNAGSVSIVTTAAPEPGRPIPPPIPADSTLYTEIPLSVGDTELTNLTIALRVGARVSGRVEFDGSGERPDAIAIANMRVTLEPADGSKLPDDIGQVTGRVNQDGRFTTYGVPPGNYLVRVGGLPDWFFKGALSGGRDVADSPLQLGTDDVTGVVATLTDKPSLVAGMVRSSNAPDSDAIVLAFPVDNDVWATQGSSPRRLRSTRATATGAYTLPVLPPGDYYLVAVKEMFGGDWRDPALLERLARSAVQVHLDDGERKTLDLRTVRER